MSSGRTVSEVLMAASRAAASKNKKRKTPDDDDDDGDGGGATTNKTPNSNHLMMNRPSNSNDSKPKEKEATPPSSLSINDKIASLRKKPIEFNPHSAAFWKDGEPVPFLFLARALDLISRERGRIAMTDIQCNVFRTIMATTPQDLIAAVYLSVPAIAPSHEGVELGIGEASLIKVLAEAYGRNEEHIKNQNKGFGDLGLVAKASRSSQRLLFKPSPLTIARVLDTFRIIAKETGKDSQEKKRNHIKGLLVAAIDCEPLYIIRLLQSKMRIGSSKQTVLVALGQASVYSEKHSNTPPLEEAAKIIKQVYSVLPIYDKIVSTLLHDGIWKLPEKCTFTLGMPVRPMLAKPAIGVTEILDKFQDTEFTCEYKYDGVRAQVHYMDDGSVEIYSRNAECYTGKFPDVVSSVSRCKKPFVRSFVLDCEVVAYDHENQKILSFQMLSTRARKGVILSDIKVQVCIFAFDILYINGQPLLQEQLKVRREHLYNSFEELPGTFQFAKGITSNDLGELHKFLETAVNNSCEGLIIKTLIRDATYEPSKRSLNWLKLKKDYMNSTGDSLDLVPIAAFHGCGKRTGVYGAFLLACYDEQNEEYQSICKIGTFIHRNSCFLEGTTENMLEELSARLRDQMITKPKEYYQYGGAKNPDVWFEPSEVWEVKPAGLSVSPVYRAASGVVDPIKGISLRFPRFLRVREDKAPDEATTSEQVAEMYRSQKINHANNQDNEEDD
ncbi:hypothetical protein AAC387_Pa02g0886 [Persea americana]